MILIAKDFLAQAVKFHQLILKLSCEIGRIGGVSVLKF